MKLDLKEYLAKLLTPKVVYIAGSDFTFESGHGSGTIGGDGIRIIISNNTVAFTGQLNCGNFTFGSSGTPYMRTAKPSELPANATYTPAGIGRWGTAGGNTPNASTYSIRDRFWVQTDANYMYVRSANFLAGSGNGWLELIFFGATFPLAGV